MRHDDPLPPRPIIGLPDQDRLMDLFSIHFLPYFEFLIPARFADLSRRYATLPDSLGPDQTALIYSCLCLAKFKELSTESGALRSEGYGEDRQDIAWYRYALKLISDWGSASCTALRQSRSRLSQCAHSS